MPNWVKSKLIIDGPKSKEIMESLLVNVEDETKLDFNKIIKMPDDLNIDKGTFTTQCMEIFLTYLNPEINYIGQGNKDKKLFEDVKKVFNNHEGIAKFTGHMPKDMIAEIVQNFNHGDMGKVDEYVALGKRAYENLKKYHHLDWYSWSIANWGTKWNACHTEYDKNNPNEINFDTAWSEIRVLISELSKQYPKNTFYYEYADEDIGYQTGYMHVQNNRILDECEYDDFSKEAYEHAFQLWGEDIKSCYKFDKRKNTYVYIDNEEDGGME